VEFFDVSHASASEETAIIMLALFFARKIPENGFPFKDSFVCPMCKAIVFSLGNKDCRFCGKE
jgi:hypothetical protein